MKEPNLASWTWLVKGLLILKLSLFSPAYGSLAENKSDLMLAKGEQTSISFLGLMNYSIGNSEVISKKRLKNSLLLKAKSIGYTDLKIWDKNGLRTFHIYVHNKVAKLKLVALFESLKSIGLNPIMRGDNLEVYGEIENEIKYYRMHQLMAEASLPIWGEINLATKAQMNIKAETFIFFAKKGIKNFDCEFKHLYYQCFILSPLKLEKEELKELPFLRIVAKKRYKKNYILKLKLIQVEQLDGREISFGLYQLSSNLTEFFTKGWQNLVEQNQISLKDKKISIYSLAEPTITTEEEQEATFSIGAEIPYRADTINAVNTQWRFAGLKIKLKIFHENEGAKIWYSTEFTKPSSQGSISGSQNQGMAQVPIGHGFNLFSINYLSNNQDVIQTPLISQIPILGKLFKSNIESSTYKNINGIIVVEEIP